MYYVNLKVGKSEIVMLPNNEFVPLMILDASIATIYYLFSLLFFFFF